MGRLIALGLCFASACTAGVLGDGEPTTGDSPVRGDARRPGDTSGGDNAAGDPTSGGDDYVAPPQSCADKTAAIVAATGTTIEVSPGGFGEVVVAGNPTTLRQVVSSANPGDTILLADGTYTFAESTGDTSYTGLYFTTRGITLRSASGDASAVILDSNYADHGGTSGLITVDAADTVIASITVMRSIFHLIHVHSDGDNVVVHDVRLVDGGEQFIKASGTEIDGGEVSCSSFFMTSVGRDNVWGYGGVNTHCYTGGVDIHDSRDWWIHDNYLEGIYCNHGGVPRPDHGKKGELRANTTYTGGLSEHAIHVWDAPDRHGHLIERNRIVNCARGIGFGMLAEVYDTVIRNNTVYSEHPGNLAAEHDVGIIVERSHDSLVVNNTVFYSSSDAYPNAIEYRRDSTESLEVRNNLTNRRIFLREGAADTVLSNNVENAAASWFGDLDAGDLHLSSCSITQVVGQGVVHAGVTDDIDQELRSGSIDIGADQCQ